MGLTGIQTTIPKSQLLVRLPDDAIQQKCATANQIFRRRLPTVRTSVQRYNAGNMLVLTGSVPFAQFEIYQAAKREAESSIGLVLETLEIIDLDSEKHVLESPKLIICRST